MDTSTKRRSSSRRPKTGRRRSVDHVKAPPTPKQAVEQEAAATGGRRRSLFHVEADVPTPPSSTRGVDNPKRTPSKEARRARRRRSSLFHVNQVNNNNGSSRHSTRTTEDERSVASKGSLKSATRSLNPFTRIKDSMDRSLNSHHEGGMMGSSRRHHSSKDLKSKRDRSKTRKDGSSRRRNGSTKSLKSKKDHRRRRSMSMSTSSQTEAEDECAAQLQHNMQEMERLVQALHMNPESRKILQEHLHKAQKNVFATKPTAGLSVSNSNGATRSA